MAARDRAIDQFRGLAVLLMLPANYLEHIACVPWWLKHKVDVGLTVVDLIAPFFIFAVALTFGESVRRRRLREGWQKTIEHVVKRAMALVGIGALFSLGETSYGFNPHGIQWGTLQAIGVATLLTFPTLFLPTAARLGFALLLLAGYQVAVDRWWLEAVLASSHAGLQGSLSWGALLMLGTVYADLVARGQWRRYLGLAVLMLAAGLALAVVVPVSKHRMSFSFDLLVSAGAALTFAATHLVVSRWKRGSEVLDAWGANSLVLYVSHLVLLAVFLVPEARWWHAEAGPLQALVQGLAYVGVLVAWGRFLYRRNILIAL